MACFRALAVADLPLGVDPAQEQLAVLLDHLADPRTFHDVGADPQDLHRVASPSPTAAAAGLHLASGDDPVGDPLYPGADRAAKTRAQRAFADPQVNFPRAPFLVHWGP